MDRISGLPDFVIHQIMSYLSTKEVAQISILSKRWNYLRKTFPILDLDQTFFVQEDVDFINFSILKHQKRFGKRIKKFMKFVEAYLDQFCQHKLCIQRFRLFVSVIGVKRSLSIKKSTSLVDKWIGLAVDNEVKEFDFEVLTSVSTTYTLPQIIFSAKSATTLRLAGCKLEQPSESIKFYSLKKLTLERVFINEEMAQKLIRGSPLLEEVCFSSCLVLKHFYVFKAPNLKIMKFDSSSFIEVESFEISVPSLQELTLQFYWVRRPQLLDISGCTHLKKLTLKSINYTDQEFHHLISKFPLLEHLTVFFFHQLERITISSNSKLKDLRFSYCRNLKAVEVDTSNALSFVYDYIPFISLPIEVVCMKKVKSIRQSKESSRWCFDVKEFLRSSSEIDVLCIHVTNNMGWVDFEEFRRNCRSLPSQVQSLNLEIEPPFDYNTSEEYMTLLDSILLVCHPRIFFVESLSCHHKFFKFFYEKLNSIRETSNCCSGLAIKCWRHYLDDISIMSFYRNGDNRRFTEDELLNLVNTHRLTDVWPLLPPGTMWFYLEWRFPSSFVF